MESVQKIGTMLGMPSDTLDQVVEVAATISAFGGLAEGENEQEKMVGDRQVEDVAKNTAITAQEGTVEQTIEQMVDAPPLADTPASAEAPADLGAVTERWYPIQTIPWTAADKEYIIINSTTNVVKYPSSFLSFDSAFSCFMRYFTYARAKVVIKTVALATKFQVGAIATVYAAVDGMNSKHFKVKTEKFRNLRAVPHSIINIANATEGQFTIEYNNKTPLFDKEWTDPLGYVYLIPWSNLRSPASTTSNISVQLFAKIVDLQVYGMSKEKRAFEIDMHRNARLRFMNKIKELEQSGADVEIMYDLLDQVTARLAEADALGKVNIAAHMINTVNCEHAEDNVLDLAFDRQSINPGNKTVNQKPLTMKALQKIPVPITDFDWKTTDVANKVLFQVEIGPQPKILSKYAHFAATTNWPKYAGLTIDQNYVSNKCMFGHYWRGNLKYTFEFFNSALHKGRVMIGYLYGERSYAVEKTANFITHDLGVQDKVEIVVPFNCWREYQQCLSVPDIFQMFQTTTKKYNNQRLKASSLGVIGVSIINTLQATSTMVSSVRVKCSISCADLEVIWPRFPSQHFRNSGVSNKTNFMWNGHGLGIVLKDDTVAHTEKSFYPMRKSNTYGNVPALTAIDEDDELSEAEKAAEIAVMSALLEEGELEGDSETGFVGSFAAQPLETTSQPVLPSVNKYTKAYIKGHVDIDTLMTRPSLAMHGTAICSFKSSLMTGNNTFKNDLGWKDAIIVQNNDYSDIEEIHPGNPQREWSWPWHKHILPIEQQQEICRSGTYWNGICRVQVFVEDVTPVKLTYSEKEGTTKNLKIENGTGVGAPMLYVTYSDEPCFTIKDLLANGAYAMNTGQQKMLEFDVPYYQIENVKKLDESDMMIRLFVTYATECAFRFAVYFTWRNFNLYYPTLVPSQNFFCGFDRDDKKHGTFEYMEYPQNWAAVYTSYPGIEEHKRQKVKMDWKKSLVDSMKMLKFEADGALPSKMPKVKCQCTATNIETGCKVCGYAYHLTEVGICRRCTIQAAHELADIPNQRLRTLENMSRRAVRELKGLASGNPKTSEGFDYEDAKIRTMARDSVIEDVDDTRELEKAGDVESNPGPCACKKHTAEFPQRFRRYMHDERVPELNELGQCFEYHSVSFSKIRKIDNWQFPCFRMDITFRAFQKGKCVHHLRETYSGEATKFMRQILRRRIANNLWMHIYSNYTKEVNRLRAIPCSGNLHVKELETIPESVFEADGLFGKIIGTASGMIGVVKEVCSILISLVQSLSDVRDYLANAKRHVFGFLLKLMIAVANLIENPGLKTAKYVVAGLFVDVAMIPGVATAVWDAFAEKWVAMLEWLVGLFVKADDTEFEMVDPVEGEPEFVNAECEAFGMAEVVGLIFTTVSTVLLGAAGVTGVNIDAASSSAVKGMRNIGQMTNGMRGLAWFADTMWKTIDRVFSYWTEGITPEERASTYYTKNKDVILSWYSNVMDFAESYRKEETIVNITQRGVVKDMYETGKDIHAGLLMAKEHQGMFTKLRNAWGLVQGWNKDITRMQGCNQTRPEPVVVYLYGDPGQGKTFVASQIACHMAKFFGNKEGAYYSLPPGFKYLDGYAQQPVMMIDDIGQGTDDEDWKVFCQMVSSSPWIPPMASLEEKGLPFITPFIICTSNISEPKPETIHTCSAIHRRLLWKIKVTAERQFSTDGNLDVGKVLANGGLKNMKCVKLEEFENAEGQDTWEKVGDKNFDWFMNEIKIEIIKRQKLLDDSMKSNETPIVTYEQMLEQMNFIQDPAIIGLVPRPRVEEIVPGEQILLQPSVGLTGDGSVEDFSCCDNCHYSDYDMSTTISSPEGKSLRITVPSSGEIKRLQVSRQCLRCWNTTARNKGHNEGMLDNANISAKVKGFSIKSMLDQVSWDINTRAMYKTCPYILFKKAVDDNLVGEYMMNSYWMSLARLKFNYEELHQSIWSQIKNFTNKHASVIKYIAYFTSIVALCSLAYKGIEWWMGEGYSDGEHKGHKKPTMKPVDVNPKVGNAHGDTDARTMVILKNQLVGVVYCGDKQAMTGMFTFIDSVTIMTCAHVMAVPDGLSPSHIRFHRGINTTDVPIEATRMVEAANGDRTLDLTLIRLRTPFFGMKSIMKHFVTDEQLKFTDSKPLQILTKSHGTTRVIMAKKAHHMTKEMSYTSSADVYRVSKYIAYVVAERGKGDSGALITTGAPGVIEGAIFGMHVAGINQTGLALPITQDILKTMMMSLEEADFAPVEPPLELDGEFVGDSEIPFVGESVPIIGSVKPINVARKTDYKPSPIQGKVLPVLRQPAAMSVKDSRVDEECRYDPMFNMMKKYATDVGYVDPLLLNETIEWYSNKLINLSVGEKVGILTDDQAINGLGTGESLEQIPLSTSPGYPYSLEAHGKGKRPFLEEDYVEGGMTHYKMGKQLAQRCYERINLAEQRKRIEGSYFQTALKNELRTNKKIKLNACRTIEGCPLDYLLSFRKYYGSFANWITKNYGHETSSSVGTNVDVDWSWMYDVLEANGNDTIAVDFTNWDGKVPPQFMYAAVTVINNWYREHLEMFIEQEGLSGFEATELRIAMEKECNVRDTLMDEIVVTISVVNGKLILTINGLPSGHPLTAILNCIIHKLLLGVTWAEIQKALGVPTNFAEFDAKVKSYTYGDDGISTVRADTIGKFDRFDVARVATKAGMICTMEDKDSEMTASSPLLECSFLKRKFLPAQENSLITRAPIEMRTIGSLLNWVRDSADFTDNIEDAMWFLYHHGQSKYNGIRRKILVALADVDISIAVPTWQQQWQNHQIMFNMLPSEWRARPFMPRTSILISRMLRSQWQIVENLRSNGKTVKDWQPPKNEKALRKYQCSCGKVVFAMLEGQCLYCLGASDIPEWYCRPEQDLIGRSEGQATSDHDRLLLSGDIESNPGPVWSQLLIKASAWAAYEVFSTLAIDWLVDDFFNGERKAILETRKLAEFLPRSRQDMYGELVWMSAKVEIKSGVSKFVLLALIHRGKAADWITLSSLCIKGFLRFQLEQKKVTC